MGPALGGLRRANDSCSPTRTTLIEQLDVVEDNRLSLAFSHRTSSGCSLGRRSAARNWRFLIHWHRLPDLAPSRGGSAGAAVDTGNGLCSLGAAGTRPAYYTSLFGCCSAGPRWPPATGTARHACAHGQSDPRPRCFCQRRSACSMSLFATRSIYQAAPHQKQRRPLVRKTWNALQLVCAAQVHPLR